MLTTPFAGRSLARNRVASLMIGSIAATPLALAAVPSSASAQVAHHGHHASHHVVHHASHHTGHHASHHAGHHQAKGHHAHHVITRAQDAALRAKILKIAASKRGTPYVYGATGPNAFDCSGFTKWVFAHLGVNLARVASSQVGDTRIVHDPKPGDLVFFGGGGGVYHVAIYAGHGEIWHAPEPGRSVTLEHLWTGDVFYGEVRGV